MENENQKLTDFSLDQLQKLQAYQEAGLPGVSAVDAGQVARMMEMYLDGKTYSQIARTHSLKIEVVLYYADKTNWCQHKHDRMIELSNNLQERLLDTKLASQNFINDLMAFWHKRIGKKITTYLVSGNESDGDKVKITDIDKYLKTAEILAKIADGKGLVPPVNNLDQGVTRETKPVDAATSKSKAIGNVLKDLANLRREEENNKSMAKPDSNNE